MTALLGDLFSKDVMPERLAHSEKVKRELSLYKAEHSAELDFDPLKWWQSEKACLSPHEQIGAEEILHGGNQCAIGEIIQFSG